jgi:predicted lipoprotein with Yx(FWY)xxD motif
MSHRTILALTAGVALVGACEQPRDPVEPAAAVGEEAPMEAARVAVQQHEDFGQYLTDEQGRTVYAFSADEPGERSACFGECARTWPPVFTQEGPEAAHPAVDADELDTLDRDDETRQATYHGWPLYYYVRDARPMDVEGQGAEGFGGTWFILGPDGERIEVEEDEGILEGVMPDDD